MSHRIFIERLVIALAMVVLALLLWRLRGLLVLVFGAVLVAVILSLIAHPIRERLRVPQGLALFAAVLIVIGLLVTCFWLFGAEVVQQSSALGQMIPEAWRLVESRLDDWGLGDPVRDALESVTDGSGVVSNIGGIAMSVGAGLADALLIIVGGIYLAAQPRLYRRGIVKLFPQRAHRLATQALDDSGEALRLWLFGQLVSMLLVGLLTGLGLWLIGVPSALTLGILAGLLEFIPYVGPIAAAVPAVLLALAVSPEMAIWTVGLYLVIQQIEGNVIQPLVQQRAVELPPALLLFSLVAGGTLFGIIGILFAAPLTVVIYTLVKRLYVREALGTPTKMPMDSD